MSAERLRFPDPAAAAAACAEFLTAALAEGVKARGSASFAISGGSSPKRIFEAMARSGLDWGRIHLFWVDERIVPPGDPQSNFAMAEQALIGPAGIPAAQVHRVRGELTPQEASRLYVEEIAATLGPGIPRFDAIHCGMGPDGHTASLFPGDPKIADREGIAAPVYVEKMPAKWRVTLLPGVLLAARATAVFATGADKAAMLRAVFDEPFDPVRLPAQLLAHPPSEAKWFVDEAAY